MKPIWLLENYTVTEETPEWLVEAYRKLDKMPARARELREAAEESLYVFAKLVNPGYMYGSIHREAFEWMQDYELFGMEDTISQNKLLMFPRAHLKSHMVATWCAWIIVRHPEVSILYVSATAELAEIQLYDIQNILESSQFNKYFPEYVHPQDGKREKWTTKKIIIDHPKRKVEGIRDATIATAGLTTNTTGWHADIVAADDLVIPENAYTEDGRESVSKKASQFVSIRNPGGFTMACGTRYHPADIYDDWKGATVETFDKDEEYLGKELIWQVMERKVEVDDVFLWPRAVREDGKAFGFNKPYLARIKAEYSDQVQFHAQYYNDPNDPGSKRMDSGIFNYYNPKYLKNEGNTWTYKGRRLNLFAAVDFAYSLNKKADWTAIVVIGIDWEENIYVLDIARFKTMKTIEYFKEIKRLHQKWQFKKLNAEVTAAQVTIVDSIKGFLKKDGRRLKVLEYRPSKAEGNKESRIRSILEHRYEELSMWHFEGGYTQLLEDELTQSRPKHDDIKDALASAVSISTAPQRPAGNPMSDFMTPQAQSSRFGGF